MDHNEYRALCEQIRHHNELYYNQDAPEISDFEYDALMRRLKKAEKEHPEYVTADSPTQKVGGKRVIGSPVQHRIPMLSLEDVFDRKSVYRFVETVKEIVPMPYSLWRKRSTDSACPWNIRTGGSCGRPLAEMAGKEKM